MGVVELIRLETQGRPLVLNRAPWGGGNPTKAEFEAYARTALEGFYEPGFGQPRPGVGFRDDGIQLCPEAVRFLDDSGAELWRVTLRDMLPSSATGPQKDA